MKLNLPLIEDLTLNRGWSHGELARQSGLHKADVSGLLAGRRPGSPKTWKRLADAFDLTVSDILADDEVTS
jgi:plasmid maintenance system antidote protein VapI